MLRSAALGLLLLAAAKVPAAEEIEPLEGDFLEYLANMETDEDDWTLLADAEAATQPPAKTPEGPSSKAAKEPAKPAVEKP